MFDNMFLSNYSVAGPWLVFKIIQAEYDVPCAQLMTPKRTIINFYALNVSIEMISNHEKRGRLRDI